MKLSAVAGAIIFSTFMCGIAAAADPGGFWEDPSFGDGVVKAGTFMLLDSSERLGAWRTVGENGNVAWTSTTYQHHGFNFVAQNPGPKNTANWVNLAGLSQSATGLAHHAVPTTIGASYTLTFYVGNVYDPNGVYGTTSTVVAYANGALLGRFTNRNGKGSVTQNWQQFSTAFVATAPYTVIAFINGDPPGDLDCGLDNAVLAPTAAASRGAAR